MCFIGGHYIAGGENIAGRVISHVLHKRTIYNRRGDRIFQVE